MRAKATLLSLALSALFGCGSETNQTASAETATATTKATVAPTASAASSSKRFPLVIVDDQGPTVDGQRSYLKKTGGLEKLAKDVAALPIDGKEVPVTIEKNATIPDVVALVKELGSKGAPTVKLTAESRGDLPKEIVVTPQSKMAGAAPPCAVVAIITENFETDVWTIKGTTAKKGPKGFAGPDMSMAVETLKKDLAKCDAKVAFFSADEKLPWTYAHMIAGAIRASDVEKKIEQLVLLDEVPVPGRPVKSLVEAK